MGQLRTSQEIQAEIEEAERNYQDTLNPDCLYYILCLQQDLHKAKIEEAKQTKLFEGE